MSTLYTSETHTITTTFRDATGTLADPDRVEVYVVAPDHSKLHYTYGTDPEIVQASAGVYTIDVTFVASGQWEVWSAFVDGGVIRKTERLPLQVSKSPW